VSPWLSDALLRSQSDERLVALAREGRERAFSTLVERYRRPLLGFARRIGAGERAEDVVQQALMQAWTALQNGAEVAHARGWLHQIVRHAAWKSAARPGGGDELPGTLAGAADPQLEVETRMQMRHVVDEVLKLPGRQRDALVQTALEGRSREEVALGLGLTEGAVRQLVHRARSSVRAACTALTPGPLVAWAARHTSPGRTMPSQVAEALAGGGAVGAAAATLKVSALVAAGALATGAIVSSSPTSHRDRNGAVAQSSPSAAGRSGVASPQLAPTAGRSPAQLAGRAGGDPGHGHGRGHGSGSASARRSEHAQTAGQATHGASGPGEHSGPSGGDHGGSGSGDRGPGGGGGSGGSTDGGSSHDGSGSGSGGSGSSGSDSSGSGSSGSGSSGSGSGDALTTDSHSGSGSGSHGGTSGHDGSPLPDAH
jgi:RNA polymerase sigma factor (sigma-70 family)